MARIKNEDIEKVRERARVDEVIGEYVTLKSAGSGTLKGLCPFHDEKTPSFHVRPAVGLWHCFGCGEGGDTIGFVRKINSLDFVGAVEYLAGRYGVELHYEEGSGGHEGMASNRQRLLDAHRIAAAYYAEQLNSAEGQAARDMLKGRGFDRDAAERFGVGYAPKGWENLLRQLRNNGFTEPEIQASGLASQGQRGVYDRFRGRVVWPIRDVTGAVLGFGARRLYDDDQGPKYLNTPETAIYHKSHVLYGVDLAKRDISQQRSIVIVEGYTDVMAAQLAGVTTAVATCGTAFGPDHIRVVRRLLGDVGDAATGVLTANGVAMGGQVIFTFDGDAAGQKAALRAFQEDQLFYAQTFVSVAPDGMDPCELRQNRGEEAVRQLIAAKVPLFRFAIQSALSQLDLDTAEGRVAGLRAAAPVVARIRDHALRADYVRQLAGWLGIEEKDVQAEMRRVTQRSRQQTPASGQLGEQGPYGSGGQSGQLQQSQQSPAGTFGQQPTVQKPPSSRKLNDPIARMERQALAAVLQHPDLVPPVFDSLAIDTFVVPMHRAVHEAIQAAGGAAASAGNAQRWLDDIRSNAAQPVAAAITELAVEPLPIAAASGERADGTANFVTGIVNSIVTTAFTRHIAEARGRLQRIDAQSDPDAYRHAFETLVSLENERREHTSQP